MTHRAALAGGCIDIHCGSQPLLLGLRAVVDLTIDGRRSQHDLTSFTAARDAPGTFTCEPIAGLQLRLALRTHGGAGQPPWAVELVPSLHCQTRAGLQVHSLLFAADVSPDSFLHGVGSDPSWRLFLAGYNSFAPAVCRDSREHIRWPRFEAAGTFNQYAESVYFGRDEYLSSPWYATFTRLGDDPATLLVGWLGAQIGLGELALRRPRGAGSALGEPARLEARLSLGGKRLSSGQLLTCEGLLFGRSEGGQGDALLSRYVDVVAGRMNARPTVGDAPTGWCSWYFYYTRVAEEPLRKNLAVLQSERAGLPVRYIQLDDGYQSRVGDWLSPNAKFGGSLVNLGRLARDIRRAGFLPGIWVAPFIAQRSSQLFAQHPDWILAGQDGTRRRIAHHLPWGLTDGQIYPLDLSHPAVLQHLEKVFRTLRELGFAYFKIDFLSAGLRDGRRHDPSLSPVEAFRGALVRIRAAVGDDFLLGCGAPLLPAIGLCDGLRVSSDVKEDWRDPTVGFFAADCGHPAAELALWNDVTRAHLHRRWFINDPDCLLVRERDSRLTRAEIESLVSVLALSGGSLFLSDDMSRLSSDRRALAEQTLPVREGGSDCRVRALGLLTEKRPTRLVRLRQRPEGSELLAAVINWGDSESPRRLQLTDLGLRVRGGQPDYAPSGYWHCYESWRGQYQLLAAEAPLTLHIPAHGSALLSVKPQLLCPRTGRPRPQIVALTHHATTTLGVLQRESWDPDRMELQLALELLARRSGDLILYLPPGYSLRDASTDSPTPIKVQPASGPGPLRRLTLNIDDRSHVRLRFAL